MKKAGKIVLYILLSILLLVVVLVVVAGLARNKIVKLALEQISETTNIPVEVGEIDFSLVRNFPLATLDCRDLLVKAPDTLNVSGSGKDTLLHVGRLYISVQARPLLKGIFEIKKIELADADVYYKVDSLGKSNYDFLLDTTQTGAIDTSSNAIYLDVKTLKLEHVSCHYHDQQRKANAKLLLEEVDLAGLIDNDQYFGTIEGKASVTNCTLPQTQLEKMQKASLIFDLDYKDRQLMIRKAGIELDANARFSVSGQLALGDSLLADLDVRAENMNVAGLMEYIPSKYLTDYGFSRLDGMINLDAGVTGCLNDSLALPHVDARLELSNGSLKYLDYPEIKQLVLKAKATNGANNNNRTTKLEIDSMSFRAANSSAGLNGTLENLDRLTYVLNSVIDLDLNDLKPFVPDSVVKNIAGRITGLISTKGVVPDSVTNQFINPLAANTSLQLTLSDVKVELDSLLSVSDLTGQLQYKSGHLQLDSLSARVPAYHLKVKNLNLNTEIAGEFTKPESLSLAINGLDLATDSCSLSLKGNLTNLMAPDYSLSGKIKLNLAEVHSFLPGSLVSGLSGNILADVSSAAQINPGPIQDQITDVLFNHSDFTLGFRNVSVNMPDSLMCVQQLSGNVKYKADTARIDQLEGNYRGLRFGANSTTISNVYTAAIQNKPKELRVTGSFSVDTLNYAWIEALLSGNSANSSVDPKAKETGPMNFTCKVNGKFQAGQLRYGSNVFRNIDTDFLVKESYYVFDSLRMEAYHGKALSSVKIEMKPEGEMDLFFKTNMEKMDVSEMVKGLKEYIPMGDLNADNVKGEISTKMDGKIVLDQNFDPVYNSLMLNGDLTIENGVLINVKPVMEVEKIAAVGLKNMDKLYFNTLNSSIFLFNNKLYIPQTEIRSTSFDAMFLGMYSFGEDYAYHIRMFLGEVLSSKSKANLKKQSQDDGFEEDQDDLTKGRTSIYLVSKKENGKEKAWFDNKKDRTNMAAKVNLQKQMVEMRFHPDLVKYHTKD